jgi:hypothetical protein
VGGAEDGRTEGAGGDGAEVGDVSSVVIEKGEDGKLRGASEADEKRYAKFRRHVEGMPIGDTMRFTFAVPRSPAFHRRHFAILKSLFAAQEQFTDAEKFREWTQVGAGFCDLLPGPKGKPVAVSRSIAWENLEEAEFAEHHAAVLDFVRSVHFSRFLWPHLSDQQGALMVETILMEFGT